MLFFTKIPFEQVWFKNRRAKFRKQQRSKTLVDSKTEELEDEDTKSDSKLVASSSRSAETTEANETDPSRTNLEINDNEEAGIANNFKAGDESKSPSHCTLKNKDNIKLEDAFDETRSTASGVENNDYEGDKDNYVADNKDKDKDDKNEQEVDDMKTDKEKKEDDLDLDSADDDMTHLNGPANTSKWEIDS